MTNETDCKCNGACDLCKSTITVHAPELGDEGYNFNIGKNLWNVVHSLPESGRDQVIWCAWQRTNANLLALYADGGADTAKVVDCGLARSDLFECQLKVALFVRGLGDEPPATLLTDWLGKWYVTGLMRNGLSAENAVAAFLKDE